MEKEYEELIVAIKSYDSRADISMIKKAWEFAKLAHTGQKRKSGEDYVIHPLRTARILADWRLDNTSIVAGLLHDTIENGAARKDDLCGQFGEDVCTLVDGVTKVSELRLKERKGDETVENLRKLVVVMAKDLRVVFVKLASRLHNMRTLQYLDKKKAVDIAQEVMDIYAPLAERIGMSEVKIELNDLTFRYLYPKEHEKLERLSFSYYKKAKERLKKVEHTLLSSLAKENIKARIESREKGKYSLWKKMTRPEINWNFERAYDIIALRIITQSVGDCYSALGVVHRHYNPKLIKDFIAQPKPNGYQAIHTICLGPSMKPVEVQIRTEEMHEHAEYGAASHWVYSQMKEMGVSDSLLEERGADPQMYEKLSWVKQLVKWQEKIENDKEYLKAVKLDVLADRQFIFSPKGDVFDLPVGATPIDFACAVHTNLVYYMKGAKVNGRMVSLSYKLKSRDVVEILMNKKRKDPPRDWENLARTTIARKEIRKAIRKSFKK